MVSVDGAQQFTQLGRVSDCGAMLGHRQHDRALEVARGVTLAVARLHAEAEYGAGRLECSVCGFDGASRFQAFLLIVMPLSTPGIIATAIYSFIMAWNEYVYALTFINDKSRLVLSVGLQRFFAEFATNWPGLMAASFIMSVPVVVLFLFLQRHFVKALTEGAVKS